MILIACDQIPYCGGANTRAYNLFGILSNRFDDMAFLNILDEKKVKYYEKHYSKSNLGNPDNLKDVFNVVVSPEKPEGFLNLKRFLYKLNPIAVLCVNRFSALYIKKIRPDLKVLFFPSSCRKIIDNLNAVKSSYDAEKKLLSDNLKLDDDNYEEREAVKLSDSIIFHSESVKIFYEYFYPEYRGKMHSELVYNVPFILEKLYKKKIKGIPFHKRKIDLTFVASRWDRPEKNYEMVKKIAKSFDGLKISVVGECEEKQKNISYYGLIEDYPKVLSLMADSKVLISTSLYDASPNVLFEAAFLNCNIVASRNCGNRRLCHSDLLVSSYTLNNYISCIEKALKKPYKSNLDIFLRSDSIKILENIIREELKKQGGSQRGML